MKRILCAVICCAIMCGMLVMHAAALDGLKIEQIVPLIPEINAVVKLQNEKDENVTKADCFAKFGNESLTVSSFEKFDAQKHKSCVYFLVDSSNSISAAYLKEIKKNLVRYSDQMSENETMVLISFGTKVKSVLNGGESKETRKKKINGLTANEHQTNLLNAIRYTVEKSQAETSVKYDRSYAVVISDGQNYEVGGGNTQQEVMEIVSGHGLPVYSICVGNDRSSASSLGALSRSSGGEIFTATAAGEVSKSFKSLKKNTANAYLIQMQTRDHQVSDGASRALMIRIKNKSAGVDVKPTRWITDDEAPVITDIESIRENGTVKLYVYYSEYVSNADQAENFILQRKDSAAEIAFADAEYRMDADTYYTVLTPKKEPAKYEDYLLSVKNITDVSNEMHALESPDRTYTLGEYSAFVLFFLGYWWVLLIAVLLIGGGIALGFVLKRKKRADAAEQEHITGRPTQEEYFSFQHDAPLTVEQHHVVSPQGKRVEFKVYDGTNAVRSIKTTVADRLTFGRSDECNIYFDDPKMSRVHFEIALVQNDFWINDLNSSNGTKVNNIRIQGRQKLNDRDVIFAGQTTITIIIEQ